MRIVDGAPRFGLQVDRVVAGVAVHERSTAGADAERRTLGAHVHHGSETLQDIAPQEERESIALDDRELDQVGLSAGLLTRV